MSEAVWAMPTRCILTSTMKRKLAFLVLSLIPAPISGQTKAEDRAKAEVQKTLGEFITAFDNLDWEKFRSAFADDATVFYPRGFPGRASGRDEFEKNFKTVFEQIRTRRSSPPYMDIQPRQLEIQVLGSIAIATFHLDDKPHFLNRRTIVLQRSSDGWKIVHLHASEVQTDAIK